jgi:hypothetical protein
MELQVNLPEAGRMQADSAPPRSPIQTCWDNGSGLQPAAPADDIGTERLVPAPDLQLVGAIRSSPGHWTRQPRPGEPGHPIAAGTARFATTLGARIVHVSVD